MRFLTIGMGTLLASMGISASTLKCDAQIIRTACGTGKINIAIDLDSLTYKAKIGAVACWGYEISDKGKVKKVKATYPFSGDDSYKLFHIEEDEGEVEVATLIVQGDLLTYEYLKPALLNMKKTSFGGHRLYRDKFNLICVNEL